MWPHLSYILATQGGGEVSYEQSRELDKRLNFPVLMFGTKEEWDDFSDSAGEFLNYGYEDWFDVIFRFSMKGYGLSVNGVIVSVNGNFSKVYGVCFDA